MQLAEALSTRTSTASSTATSSPEHQGDARRRVRCLIWLAKVLAGDGRPERIFSATRNDEAPPASATARRGRHEAGIILAPGLHGPEQARGAVVDKRADIWAFGVVLFEMLTAKACFAGDTVTDVLAAVVKTEPEWSGFRPAIARLRELLQRCLTKDRKQRLHDIGDARLELEETLAGPHFDSPEPRRSVSLV